ncbi:MAG: two-component regulator propeller domain-containing protein [Bacteroidota bacterium]
MNASAQWDQNLKFEHIGTKDGLIQNIVSNVIQDSRGYIWVGTYGGLQRYNGYGFRTYKLELGNPHSLSGNAVYWLTEDRKQNIWVSTTTGLNLYNPVEDRFYRFQHNPNDSTSISENRAEYTYEDSEGNLWVGTLKGDMCRFNWVDSSFTRFPGKIGGEPSIATIMEDPRDGNVLWAGGRKGVFRVNRQTGEYRPFWPQADRNHPSWAMYHFQPENDSIVWVGIYGGGVVRWNRNTDTYTRKTYHDGPGQGNIVYGLAQKSKDELWVQDGQKGIGILNQKDFSFRFLSDNLDEPEQNIPFPCTRAYFKDEAGIEWMGGWNGLWTLHSSNQNFRFYKIPNAKPVDPSTFRSSRIVEDTVRKKLFIGTRAGEGIYVLDLETDSCQALGLPIPASGARYRPNEVFDLVQEADGNLVALSGNGLFRLDPDRMTFEAVFKGEAWEEFWKTALPLTFNRSKDGTWWIATLFKGIVAIDPHTEKKRLWAAHPEHPDSLASQADLKKVIEGPDGRIWTGSEMGGYLRVLACNESTDSKVTK